MIRKAFLEKIFDAANMRRWNDKICPVELRELDKQAHKMVIAYVIGKYERSPEFNWIDLIQGGMFEFLQRLTLTDIKPQMFHKIKESRSRYRKLNQWVYQRLRPAISPLGSQFLRDFKDYFLNGADNINKRILEAAHFSATKWEFDIIDRANPHGYEMEKIRKQIQDQQEKYYDLNGIKQLALYSNLRDFIDLCGELRFQTRWSHISHRVPRTSVLGHLFIVATLSYLFSYEIHACPKRRYNDFFTGLFHDLPEVLTRDIIDPVKRSVPGLGDIVKSYEDTEMKKEVFSILPKEWHDEIEMFTRNEFANVVTVNKRTRTINSDNMRRYNRDRFNPRDGEIVLASDKLAAFMEAHLAIQNGLQITEFVNARNSLSAKYEEKTIAGIDFGAIYADFQS
jgi:putative hydrolase of HD superfamily